MSGRPSLRGWVRPRLRRAAEVLARHHVAGETAAQAGQVAQRFAARGITTTLGYWDRPGDTPADVTTEYLACLDALTPGRPGYVSVKLTALGLAEPETDRVLARAATLGRRVHLDAMDHPSAGPMLAALAGIRQRHPDADLGHTLPARWPRSVADARAAVELGAAVRVVKGQWADPDAPDVDRRAGFLQVVDALAGRAREVAVASHDVPLAAEAVRRLRAAGTPCVLELLYGLPMRASLRRAREQDVDVRVYVPYGTAYLPYALGALRREPGKIVWLARDVAGLLTDATRERIGGRAAR